uniref:Uncharacterized protein n=1 Tax=Caenorhabditis tropicalis TaxID=1561998 RepID=A0A1I7SYA1_9PELO
MAQQDPQITNEFSLSAMIQTIECYGRNCWLQWAISHYKDLYSRKKEREFILKKISTCEAFEVLDSDIHLKRLLIIKITFEDEDFETIMKSISDLQRRRAVQ